MDVINILLGVYCPLLHVVTLYALKTILPYSSGSHSFLGSGSGSHEVCTLLIRKMWSAYFLCNVRVSHDMFTIQHL